MQVDYLVAEAMLGQDAEDFLNSDIGRYIIGRAQEEKSEALKALATIDPKDSNLIQQTQNRFYRANSLIGWLNELIHEGRQAINTLESNDYDR